MPFIIWLQKVQKTVWAKYCDAIHNLFKKKKNRKAQKTQIVWAEREWVGCISCLPKALTLKLLAQLTHHCFQLDLLDVLFQISNRQGIL